MKTREHHHLFCNYWLDNEPNHCRWCDMIERKEFDRGYVFRRLHYVNPMPVENEKKNSFGKLFSSLRNEDDKIRCGSEKAAIKFEQLCSVALIIVLMIFILVLI